VQATGFTGGFDYIRSRSPFNLDKTRRFVYNEDEFHYYGGFMNDRGKLFLAVMLALLLMLSAFGCVPQEGGGGSTAVETPLM